MNVQLKVKSRSAQQKKTTNKTVNMDENQFDDETSGDSKVVKRRTNKRETKTRKAVKDPNAPKKPMSAFILFGNDERPKLKAERPDMSFTDIGKEIGKRWKEVNEEVKNKYQQLAQIDKQRYAKQLEEYKQISV